MKAQFAKFPNRDQTKKKEREPLYIKKYCGLRPDVRDVRVALDASDNGRCWWIYNFLYTYPFRIEHKIETI